MFSDVVDSRPRDEAPALERGIDLSYVSGIGAALARALRAGSGVLAAAPVGVALVVVLTQPWRFATSTDGDGSQSEAGDLTIAWEAVWAEDTDVIVYDIEAVDGHLAMTASGFGPPRGMHAWFSAGEDRWEAAEVTPPDGGDPNGTADFGPLYVADGQLHTIGFTEDQIVRGRATLFVSPDGGQSWAYRTDSAVPMGAYVHDVMPFDGRFLAVGTSTSMSDAVIWSSDDGQTWEPAPGVIGNGPLDAIAMDGDRLVAVGWQPAGAINRATFWSSSDGTAWTRSALEEAASEAWDVVAAPGGGFVAAGIANDGAAIWSSSDGTAWRRIPAPGDFGRFFAITADEEYVVAVGAGEGGPIVAASTGLDGWTFVAFLDEAPGHGPEAITADPRGEPGSFVISGPANGGVFVARIQINATDEP